MTSGLVPYNVTAPQSAHLVVKIGGTVYDDISPNFLLGMNLVRNAGGRNTFSIELSDMMDYELEEKLIAAITASLSVAGSESISFQYGHSQGAKSDWQKGLILDYTPQFLSNMNANFTITGICEGKIGSVKSDTYDSSKYGNRVSNIIKSIAEEEGWEISEPFVLSDKLSSSQSFYRTNMSAITFIQTVLIPAAKKGNNTIRMMHSNTSKGTSIKLVDIDLTKTPIPKREYNFLINSGNYGNVLSFTPTYTGVANSSLKVSAGYVDRLTNQFMLFRNDPKLGISIPADPQIMGATSPENFTSIIQDKWFSNNVGHVKASMEIVGDPEIQLLDYVNVIPMRPDGRIHHTGGTYLILEEITDSISGGMYKTSLTMVKIPGTKATYITDTYESGWNI
jgi:hypothetical protein